MTWSFKIYLEILKNHAKAKKGDFAHTKIKDWQSKCFSVFSISLSSKGRGGV
jgi:hypothetical protein